MGWVWRKLLLNSDADIAALPLYNPTMRPLVLAVCLLLSLFACTGRAGMKIYYLRHAESGANVEHQWKDVPRDQWPVYVGNANAFSPKGESQIPGVVAKLKQMDFDFIAVSPLWRARHTVLPYLEAQERTAEVWPELAEFRALRKGETLPAVLPPPNPDLFGGGAVIDLPLEERRYFTVRPGVSKLCLPSNDAVQLESDRRALTARVIDLLRARFAGTGQSVLLVGHGISGHRLASQLTGEAGIMEEGRHIHNASLWMAEEQPDGSFRLEVFNDKPWVPGEAVN
jgi:broad specificity phosphatase PhoE